MGTDDLFVVTAGGRLFARVWGGRDRCRTRVPIVLFHDSLGSVELWREFPALMAAATDRPVVAYDRLGFGKSDPRHGVLDRTFISDEARFALLALRAALEIDRMILFGHSVGGAMAVAAAGHDADAAVAVITESAQAFVEDRTLAGIREAKAGFQTPGQIERLGRYHGDKAAWVLDAWTETWLGSEFAAWALDDDLRRLRCPVLAMHGDRDEYGSSAHSQRIAALASGPAEVVIFEDCGHVPHREKPDDVVRAVCAFLEAHLPPQATTSRRAPGTAPHGQSRSPS